MTERGRYLMTHDPDLFGGSESVDFCLNFHYLQTVIDDPGLVVPTDQHEKIFTNVDYQYLYCSNEQYNPIARKTIIFKLESVLYFIHVLDVWFSVERLLHRGLFGRLAGAGVSVDGGAVRSQFLRNASNLLTAINRPQHLEDLKTLDSALLKRRRSPDFIASLPRDVLMVQI